MSETPHTRNVLVPGATIYVELRGSGPTLLLIPGGAQDAGVFAALASELSDQFTVISFDPRCNSRSVCDDTAVEVGWRRPNGRTSKAPSPPSVTELPKPKVASAARRLWR